MEDESAGSPPAAPTNSPGSHEANLLAGAKGRAQQGAATAAAQRRKSGKPARGSSGGGPGKAKGPPPIPRKASAGPMQDTSRTQGARAPGVPFPPSVPRQAQEQEAAVAPIIIPEGTAMGGGAQEDGAAFSGPKAEGLPPLGVAPPPSLPQLEAAAPQHDHGRSSEVILQLQPRLQAAVRDVALVQPRLLAPGRALDWVASRLLGEEPAAPAVPTAEKEAEGQEGQEPVTTAAFLARHVLPYVQTALGELLRRGPGLLTEAEEACQLTGSEAAPGAAVAATIGQQVAFVAAQLRAAAVDARSSSAESAVLARRLLAHELQQAAREQARAYAAALRRELSALKVSAVRKRAVGAGVDATRLEEADDAAVPKQALTELLVQALWAAEGVRAAADPSKIAAAHKEEAALRAELAACSVAVLRRRALAAGLGLIADPPTGTT